MSGALLVITDGRLEYLVQSVASIEQNLTGDITERVMFDDSGDDDHRNQIYDMFPGWSHINNGPRQGFGGAIQSAWQYLRTCTTSRWVAHLEADFIYPEPVNLDQLVHVLDTQPHLAQVALLRQAWNDAEKAAGGIIQQHPDDYENLIGRDGARWVEHRRFFTTNPSVYRRSLLTVGWPDGPNSEGIFTHQLLSRGTPETPGDLIRFAFWGATTDPPKVHHIGVDRAGTGY